MPLSCFLRVRRHVRGCFVSALLTDGEATYYTCVYCTPRVGDFKSKFRRRHKKSALGASMGHPSRSLGLLLERRDDGTVGNTHAE